MIERHTCYYKVNNTPLYRSIIEAIGFDDEMREIGISKREITELADGEFMGIFDIDPVTHPNKGFEYFGSRGVEFSMTRPSIVENLERDEAVKDCKIALKEIEAMGA